MNKKAQISAQIFIYIIATLIFSLILVYGYKAVAGLRERQLETEFIIFKQQFTNDVTTLYSTFDAKKRDYHLPAEKVCFFDKDFQEKDSAKICNEAYSEYDPVLCDAWTSSTPNNVIIDHPSAINFKAEHINMSDGYLCSSPNKGKLPLTLEGTGNKVLISGPKLVYESEFDPDKIFTINVDLPTGWSLVSFPLMLDNYSVEEAFSSLDGKYARVIYQIYDQCEMPAPDCLSGWAIDQYLYPFEEVEELMPSVWVDEQLPLEEVDHEKAYFVYMNEPGTFTLTGKVPPYVEIDMREGNNDIAFVSPVELPPEDIFGPRLPPQCWFKHDEGVTITGVWGWIGSQYTICLPFGGGPDPLKPGQGYRILLQLD